MLIFMFMILIQVTTGMVLHNLMRKSTSVFLYFLMLQNSIPPLSVMLCVFKAPPPKYPVCTD